MGGEKSLGVNKIETASKSIGMDAIAQAFVCSESSELSCLNCQWNSNGDFSP